MKFNLTPVQQTNAYSAGNAVATPIGGLSGWVVGFLLELELAKTDAGGPTTYQDWLYRSMTGMTLAGGNLPPFVRIGTPDLRILYWATRMRLIGRHRMPDMQAGAVTFRHQLPILFTPQPVRADDQKNVFDSLAGIRPATDLTLTINWAAATALGANRTIGAGTLARITLIEAIPENAGETPRYYPQWVANSLTPQQNYNNLGGSFAVDPGLIYRRTHLMLLKGASPADVRSDGTAGDAVSEIGVKAFNNQSPVMWKTWDWSQNSQGAFLVADDNAAVPGAALAAGAASTAVAYNPGVGMIDWANTGADPATVDPVWGVNLVGKPTNSLRIGLTVDNNTNLNVIGLSEGYGRY